MAKPIFIVRACPMSDDEEHSGKLIASLANNLQVQLHDYHVLTVQDNNLESFQFEVFYEKDFNEAKFEELKEIVRSYAAKSNSQNKIDN